VRILLVVVVAVAALGAGVLVGLQLDSDDNSTSTSAAGIPSEVETTRAALLEAAQSGDYEALRPLLSDDLKYTFGEPVDGGPIAYWQELERTTDERPLESLAAILKMPYVLSQGYYVWPWAYALRSSDELSQHEQDVLAPLGPPSEFFPEGIGYLGWRVGIAPDGTLAFFVAGD
jgi:hypothetical protein